MNDLKDAIKAFIRKRDWEQFHSPKNLAMALSVEVSEVLEHFQRLTQEENRNLPVHKLTEVSISDRNKKTAKARIILSY